MRTEHFVTALSNLHLENTFNPYSSRCTQNDTEDAPIRRMQSLLAILDVARRQELDSLWVGRDLGYRGGRRTGLAFTDDAHLDNHGKRWGIPIARSTKGAMVVERSATIIWEVLSQIRVSVFLWNVFPLHPHDPGDPFTNRSHSARERKEGERFLYQLIRLLNPSRLIAIGNNAAGSLHQLGDQFKVYQVRHPSTYLTNKW